MEIAILVVLILLNGMFAMSEIALVAARKSRLVQAADQGERSAKTAIALGETPTRFLSTIQIGITAIGILSGIFGEAALAAPLSAFLQEFGLSRPTSSILATTVVVICITYFSIIFGELVPKRMAQINAERIAKLVARPIAFLATLTTPFVWLLSVSTDGVLRLIGIRPPGKSDLTEEDIKSMLAEGAQSGALEQQEHDIMRNVFRLDERQVASLMTPRHEIVWLDADASREKNLQTVIDSEKSRFPVCQGGLEQILGVITAKRILKQCTINDPVHITENLQPAVYVPESLSGLRLLDHFKTSGVQLVFIVDEYADVVGLVTLQDVLVALAGEFAPADPGDAWAVRRQDDSWLLDGMIPIPELKDRLGLSALPEEDKGRYNTLAGLLMYLADSIPRVGHIVRWGDWTFEVLDLDGNRIDKVLASRHIQS